MKITILADNKIMIPKPLKAEWGFSALIEAKEVIMFDVGLGCSLSNLLVLQKPFPDKIVLSHGHYDHTSALYPFPRKLPLYAHPDIFLPRFFEGRFIGLPYQKELILNNFDFVEQGEPMEVSKGVWALGEIPRNFETATLKDSFAIRDGRKENDEIRDDQSLAIKTDKGIVLLLGCCHSGLRNTVKWAEEVLNDEVKFIIGGTHLIAFTEEKVLEILKSLKVDLIAPTHCTGLKAEMLIAKIMGEKYKPAGVGSEFEF
ncbi:MAG: 7,8-dihydropterin-6-yl-methyl-4-(beta-D-ribofuranosyl)aminobenzene 5-phosphate synthase [Archaeoglobaceae archaeon]|nr:7,8-dihydropterin-6-yl-methyl-4-(beta-D-ribofuranosyl)aminobenzene 5-phosphate synthase [Archaeoglobaceae archaeon]